MKEIIDISEEDYNLIKSMGGLKWKGVTEGEIAIYNGTVISENITNLDVLKTVFPNDYWLHIYVRRAKKDWGNSLYGGDIYE